MANINCNGVVYEVALGTTLAQAIGLHQEFAQPCAGLGRCGKCRVVVQGVLSPVTVEEQRHLSATELAAGVRLACQCSVLGDCCVQTQQEGESQVLVGGQIPTFAVAPSFVQYGVAVDIGTTTLAAQLYHASGKLLAQASGQNPQVAFGADVVSRIERSLAGAGEALAACIRAALARLLQQLCEAAGVAPLAIERLVITGNTAMLYLLTQKNPASLSHAPFAADCLFGFTCSAASLGLPCANAVVYLPPCISAYVGADITTALLASGICAGKQTALLADIGTNGEMALWHKGQLFCCSTAAGPAFEGAGLSMGMPGKVGAIDAVSPNPAGGYQIHTIGQAEPVGICGSGVIDAIAAFYATEAMDETGLLEEDSILLGGAVTITQGDVRMVQLAKSAIYAGMRTLVECTDGLSAQQVSELQIAGGFGSYINLANAVEIGLIPAEYHNKTKMIGNAALAGAAMLLLNRAFVQDAKALAAQGVTVELSSSARFSEYYMMGMLFGEE